MSSWIPRRFIVNGRLYKCRFPVRLIAKGRFPNLEMGLSFPGLEDSCIECIEDIDDLMSGKYDSCGWLTSEEMRLLRWLFKR